MSFCLQKYRELLVYKKKKNVENNYIFDCRKIYKEKESIHFTKSFLKSFSIDSRCMNSKILDLQNVLLNRDLIKLFVIYIYFFNSEAEKRFMGS